MPPIRRPFHRLIGRSAYGSDGIRIGQVRDILLDEVTGRPEWVSIATGILGARQRLAPIDSPDLRADHVVVPFTSDLVSSAPRIPPATAATPTAATPALTTAAEEMLYRHYGMTDPDPNPDPDTDTDPKAATGPPMPGRHPEQTGRHAASPPGHSDEPDEPDEPVRPAFDPLAAGQALPMDAAAPSRPAVAAIVLDPQWWDDLIERVTTITQSGANQDR